jgi:4-carboxymuconolactone decarboxylase
MGDENDPSDSRKAGAAVRSAVLGADFVAAGDKSVDDFMRPLREFIDAYCWGEIWARPGLDRKSRSIANLAMLCSLNRSHELKVHLRGALNNGVTKEEVREIFMQVAVYAGVPAALEAFRVARELFAELDAEQAPHHGR